METIYDLLYEYLEQEKIIDSKFIEMAIGEFIKEEELQKFVKKVQIYYQFGGRSTEFVEYDSFDRILAINSAYLLVFERAQKKDRFSNNIFLVYQLLYALERVKQQKKLTEKGNDLEHKLLRICLYEDFKYYQQNWFVKKMMQKYSILLNSELSGDLKKLESVNQQYGKQVPSKRMATIQSLWSVYQMLLQGAPSVEKKRYETMLLSACQSGYEQKDGKLLSPTESYLADIRRLGVLETASFFDRHFQGSLEAASSEDVGYRLYLGLPVTKEEHQMNGIGTSNSEIFESCILSRFPMEEKEFQKVKKI